MALNSLWDTHYFARSGFYTALGAESGERDRGLRGLT
jgi:hypothetical protein